MRQIRLEADGSRMIEEGAAAGEGAWLAGFHVIECSDAVAAETWLARVPLLSGEAASLHPLVDRHEDGPPKSGGPSRAKDL